MDYNIILLVEMELKHIACLTINIFWRIIMDT